MDKPVAAVTTSSVENKIKADMQLNAIAHITNSRQVILQNMGLVFYIWSFSP